MSRQLEIAFSSEIVSFYVISVSLHLCIQAKTINKKVTLEITNIESTFTKKSLFQRIYLKVREMVSEEHIALTTSISSSSCHSPSARRLGRGYSSYYTNRLSNTSSPMTSSCFAEEVCFEEFQNALNGINRHRKESDILICPHCQCQTILIITPQKDKKAWCIRILLTLTIVLSCFAFKPCLLDDLKQYEYKCVSCKETVDKFKGYEFS